MRVGEGHARRLATHQLVNNNKIKGISPPAFLLVRIDGELVQHMPYAKCYSADVKELANWGFFTQMHVIRLSFPSLANEVRI